MRRIAIHDTLLLVINSVGHIYLPVVGIDRKAVVFGVPKLQKRPDGNTVGFHRHSPNIVVDPVMVATSGSRLLEEDAVDTLKKELLPIATVITPNIPEAEILCGMEIHTEEDMEAAAKAIYEDLGCAVLLKGGHNINDANDLLYTKEEVSWFKGKRINNPNTHGTGCTLSSAIAANLAKGFDLKISVQRAKDYISRALADMLDLGAGSGPMNHAFDLKDEWKEEA